MLSDELLLPWTVETPPLPAKHFMWQLLLCIVRHNLCLYKKGSDSLNNGAWLEVVLV
jgi:hypothetical protein